MTLLRCRAVRRPLKEGLPLCSNQSSNILFYISGILGGFVEQSVPRLHYAVEQTTIIPQCLKQSLFCTSVSCPWRVSWRLCPVSFSLWDQANEVISSVQVTVTKEKEKMVNHTLSLNRFHPKSVPSTLFQDEQPLKNMTIWPSELSIWKDRRGAQRSFCETCIYSLPRSMHAP